MPPVYLITGMMASGKSTVAQALAERLPRSVHVRGDLFRRMIVSGRVDEIAGKPFGVLALAAYGGPAAVEAACAWMRRLGLTVADLGAEAGGAPLPEAA